MILYVDTSALVPVLIREPTSAACSELWEAADAVVGTRLLYIETAAAMGTAHRLGRITAPQSRRATDRLRDLWDTVDVIELDEDLMLMAAQMSRTHRLRGHDATHCAAAVLLNDDDVVAASGDRQLLTAWHQERVAVSDVTA